MAAKYHLCILSECLSRLLHALRQVLRWTQVCSKSSQYVCVLHLQNEIGPTRASAKTEEINFLNDDIASMTKTLKAAQVCFLCLRI